MIANPRPERGWVHQLAAAIVEHLAYPRAGVSPTDPTDPTAPDAPTPAGDPPDDAQLTAALAGARPAESPALVLARARVGGALFGDAVGLGRFRVLERLGGGGMGVVYAAYDPELDRGVAIKTLHVPRTGRELALSEAKALARLAHPNIVPVFDVGLAGDHVYIVMELVRGDTLRAWVKGRTRREILDAYRQAGQALVAAHRAGLVHRDFKPDNAIVGTDGRVRVVDFGLACEAATDSAPAAPPRAAGTPRYMAPEQAAGAQVTPAADQYSFSVALDEALRGNPGKALPRWIEAVIERGTAADPQARYGSMQALLRALGRDPARVRRGWIAVAAVAAVVAAAFAIGRTSLADLDEVCSGGGPAIGAAWHPVARQRELGRIAMLSPYGDELATELARQLGGHAVRWADNYRAACLAHRRGEQSAALLDRRMACLDRGRAALGALAEIVDAADAGALPGVARAARELPDPDACADVRALASNLEPPSPALAGPVTAIEGRIERARVQLAAGHADEARTGGADAVAAARAIGYRPLLAEALLVEGHALMATEDRGAAVARLTEATTLGLASGSEAIAIEAWARRAWVEGTGGHPEAALAGLDVIDALATRTSSAFARALLHNNVGSVELGRGHRAAARALFERALDDAKPVTGAGAVELVMIRTNTAIASDDPQRRDELLADAHAELARLLGDNHPDTLVVQWIRATTIASFTRAAELLAAVCRNRERHAWLARATTPCWVELADLTSELGDHSAALAALDHAMELGADTNSETPEADGYRRLWRGDARTAATAFETALAKFPVRPGEPWYRAYTRGRLSLGLGRALAAQQEPSAATAAFERSIAVLEPIARNQRAAAIDRRLGRARAELARVRAAIGAPPEATRALATAALAWLRSAGAPADEITALQRLAETPRMEGSPR
jgi:tetratricopeptide (TPR) repeat protein/predicted Ser/Thr protein kinase